VPRIWSPQKVIVNNVLTVWLLGRFGQCAVQKLNGLLSGGSAVDTIFLKAHAERCRLLAESANEFTKRRLLDLAAHYEKRVRAAEPSVATRFLIPPPLNPKDAPLQI
jgi:hypothetical protein